ncbi:type I-E CRISPR-associated protein Cse2/CasB [Streptomyces sp. NPDC003077]|uniref:type I-E CRISPR-associated protein Cse2/CasB n=1 Tax=Streptomyces sp. NPDC003077 TaxID=3154443 RepID=UPI0033BC10E1
MTLGTTPDAATARRRQHLKYVSWIERLCKEDPGARAALRSGWRRGLDSVPRMHRLVAAWLPKEETPETEQWAYYAVAAMIAVQPRSSFADTEEEPTPDAESNAPEPGTGPGSRPGDAHADATTAPRAEPDAPSPTAQSRAPSKERYGASLGAAFALAVAAGPGREREMRESAAESRLNLLTRQSITGLHRHLPSSVRYLCELGVPVDWAQLLDDLIAWPVHSGRIARHWLQDYYRARAAADRDQADAADQQELAEPTP